MRAASIHQSAGFIRDPAAAIGGSGNLGNTAGNGLELLPDPAEITEIETRVQNFGGSQRLHLLLNLAESDHRNSHCRELVDCSPARSQCQVGPFHERSHLHDVGENSGSPLHGRHYSADLRGTHVGGPHHDPHLNIAPDSCRQT